MIDIDGFNNVLRWEIVTAPKKCSVYTSIAHKNKCDKPLEVGEWAGHYMGLGHNAKNDSWWCAECTYRIFEVTPSTNGTNMKIPTVETVSAAPAKRKRKVMPNCIGCNQPFCDSCGTCETEGCKLEGHSASTKYDLMELGHLMADTQKARGYSTLAGVPGLNVPQPYKILMDAEDDSVQRALEAFGSGTSIFARPCPKRPRHGFVESRVVGNKIQPSTAIVVKDLFREAKEADPEAELLLCPTISASHNMVVTPSRMTVGEGNDGATAGRGVLTIPLLGVPFFEIEDELVRKAGVDLEKADPYIEAVKSVNGQVFYTQLRAGAKIPKTVGEDYVPAPIRVKKIVQASGNLLEWERQAKEIEADPDGIVVTHIGGSLVSHYGVHCMERDIPVLTTREPAIGEVLMPTPIPDKPNPEAVVRGLGKGILYTLNETRRNGDAVKLLLMALHNAKAMYGEHGEWLGVAAAFMMRLGMAASHGEARHADANMRDNYSRDAIYKQALVDFFGSRKMLGHVQHLFTAFNWGGSYGGPKWAECTESIMKLDVACRGVINEPAEGAVSEMVLALNRSVEKAHNGGWWLNKFTSQATFDRAAQQSIHAVAEAGPLAYGVYKADLPYGPTVKRWGSEPDIVVEEMKAFVASSKVVRKTPKGSTPTNATEMQAFVDKVFGATTVSIDSETSTAKQTVVILPAIADSASYEEWKMLHCQGRYLNSKSKGLYRLHIQFTVAGHGGYYSMDSAFMTGSTNFKPDCHSLALSGTPYQKLAFLKGENGTWLITGPSGEHLTVKLPEMVWV
jgi:hypothetical protein